MGGVKYEDDGSMHDEIGLNRKLMIMIGLLCILCGVQS